MPSLYTDAPVPPILSERILFTISSLLRSRYEMEMPPWWEETTPVLTQLVDLGIKVSKYPSAFEVWRKHKAVAECVPQIDLIFSTINAQLLRSARDVTASRCGSGLLALFLGLVDGWLRACEEHVQAESSRYSVDASEFRRIYQQLDAITRLHVGGVRNNFNDLIRFFDMLQQIEG
ncbi:uncharacterized protein E0L32_004652 [Thyridium curvatum]|uniref:Uncharacterized protein n=1 Tax=Thyridium curvatum TaxID=1093900 RepID=A0A507AX68_9PEZI|nr:uncharacterized protein E0L32_004652 [Thyridium curvatum]TPX15375.1 hypothetical protein E0L32_004652 [Thyridium curvatum]